VINDWMPMTRVRDNQWRLEKDYFAAVASISFDAGVGKWKLEFYQSDSSSDSHYETLEEAMVAADAVAALER